MGNAWYHLFLHHDSILEINATSTHTVRYEQLNRQLWQGSNSDMSVSKDMAIIEFSNFSEMGCLLFLFFRQLVLLLVNIDFNLSQAVLLGL